MNSVSIARAKSLRKLKFVQTADSKQKKTKVEYTQVSATELINALDDNALKAADKYKYKYLKIK